MVTDLVLISPRTWPFRPTVNRPIESIVPSTFPSITNRLRKCPDHLMETQLDRVVRGESGFREPLPLQLLSGKWEAPLALEELRLGGVNGMGRGGLDFYKFGVVSDYL